MGSFLRPALRLFLSATPRRALLAAAFAGLASAPAGAATTLGAAEKRDLEREARLVVDLLQNYHYSDRAFRDLDALEVIERLFEELDPRGLFFTRDDAEFIGRRFGRSLKSVYLFKGDLSPAFEIHDLFLDRARARLDWIEKRLGGAFDFGTAATWKPDTAKLPANAAQADARWEKYLQSAVLEEILAGRTEADAGATVQRRYREWRRHLLSLDALAVRERFFEIVINTFDPHSGYFSADTAKEFAVEMEGAVAGLGFDLEKKEGRCLVAAVQPGGPADLHGEIQPGDEILAFAAAGGEWTETKGRRLREIVALVRGDAATALRVAFRAKGKTERREIELVRARVVLAAERARGALFTATAAEPAAPARKVGWIELPSFYAAGEDAKLSSAARDVRELIGQLQTRGAEALVLDLRQNPGGALTEAVALSALFIPAGPVLLTRGLDGGVETHAVKKDEVAWSGPLVVLTSPRSASASEIFAAAMRFHRRAVILGAETTFGKGTVQTYMDLAKFPATEGINTKAWGVLRLTHQRFYQPDGTAVQRTGAKSDLVLPDFGEPDDRAEATLPHALPAESIPAPAGTAPATGKFTAVTPERIETLRRQLAEHARVLPEFPLRERLRALERPPAEDAPVSLNLAQRRTEAAERRAAREKLRAERRTETARSLFAVERLDIADVRAAREAHQQKLRTPLPDGTSRLHRLLGHAFIAGAADGEWRELTLATFDFETFSGDGAALADAWNAATGRSDGAAAIDDLLVQWRLLDEPDGPALLAAAANSPAAEGLEPAAVQRGVEALFVRMSELEPELLRDHRAFDVPLRESLRLAAACVAEIP